MRFCLLIAALVALFSSAAWSDIRGCECDLQRPLAASIRGCSLCLEAEKRPETEANFLLRDVNPTKPNRWLALPRKAFDGVSPLSKMPAGERLALWNLAIGKAKELWGDGWAVAMNGDISRTQCHLHVHIGKLLEGQEPGEEKPEAAKRAAGVYVDGPAELPALADGTGLWFHPAGNRLHVHAGEQTTETVLLR
jgi:hypothetical protein